MSADIETLLAGMDDDDLFDILAQLKLNGDFAEYSRNILKIQTTDGRIAPLVFNKVQLLLNQIFDEIKSERLLRAIILKGRRMGVSTIVSGRYYKQTSTTPNTYAMQITHEPQATDFLFRMVKRFYDFAPEDSRPQTRANNAKLLEFNTKDGKGLNSAFRVATGGKDDVGSGQLIHCLHLCMSLDTPILTEHGVEKLARDIELGDRVITHTGQPAQISYITRKEGGKTVKITPWMGRVIEVTPEHKVFTNMGFVPAGELDPYWHMLAMPIRKITSEIDCLHLKPTDPKKPGHKYSGPLEFPLNEETGFAIGYYLAEGNVSSARTTGKNHRVTFALHRNECHYADRASTALMPYCNKDKPQVKHFKNSLTTVYVLNSTALGDFIAEHFGRVATKHIPDWVFQCGEDFCRGIVLGYLTGDGSKGLGGAHQNYVNNSVSATSVRSSLVYQIRDLVAALGYGWGSVSHKPGGVRYERNCLEAWTVHFNGACGYHLRKDMGIDHGDLGARYKRGERYRLDTNNNLVWLRIKSLEEGLLEEVIDFEVDHPDHSFRTAHFSVSNSEFAKMAPENIESLMTSVIACVPKTDDSEVIYESTAKGIGGAFYDKFWGARYRIWGKRLDENGEPVIERTINPDAKKDNIETSIFFPWFFFDYDPQGRFKAGPDFEPTKEEQRIKKQFGVTNDQLVWRRFVIHNDYDGSVDRFNQEYPESPEVAFLGTGRPVFDNVKLFKLKEAAPPPIARYEFLTGTNQWIAKDDGRLSVWDEPKPGRHYVIGADVAEGLAKGDFSYAHVTDHQTGKQVAEWHGHIEADLFGEVLFGLGKRYNTAWIGPERNNHGLTTVTWLFNMQYPKIYCEMVPDPPGKPRKRYGWQTSSATRPLIIDHLIGELRDDCHGIMSPHVMQEMMSFKIQDNGRYEADEGQFDDRVMGTAIAKYLRQVIDLPAMKANGNRLDKPTRTISTRKRPNSRGWT